MGEVLSFENKKKDVEDKRQKVATRALYEFSKRIDSAIRFILGYTRVLPREMVGALANRLGSLISIMPEREKERLFYMAVEIIRRESSKQLDNQNKK